MIRSCYERRLVLQRSKSVSDTAHSGDGEEVAKKKKKKKVKEEVAEEQNGVDDRYVTKG